jgi:small-conductance mechanosensitive channel
MELTEFAHPVSRALSTKLFDLGGTSVTVATLITSILIVIASYTLSMLTQRALKRAFQKRGVGGEHGAGVLGRLLHYVMVVIGFAVAMQTAGIELGAMFAAGAVFAVGIGFAMQNIAQNFVSGVILLVERSIKPGDILRVEDQTVRVIEMGIRATLVRTLDEEIMIVPNSTLVSSTVKNYTIKDSLFRIRVVVGVAYDSDMALVREALEQAADDLPFRVQDNEPVILLDDFADSSVNWEVSVWTDDPWRARSARSQVREAIWKAFKRHQITIAFPQLDLHLDQTVEKSLSSLSRAA